MTAPNIVTLVSKLIADHVLMVFSKSYCPYCTRAKNLLTKVGANMHSIELDEMGDEGAQIQRYLGELTKQTTVPSIFIKGKHIGGCSDLVTLESSGKLATMLKD